MTSCRNFFVLESLMITKEVTCWCCIIVMCLAINLHDKNFRLIRACQEINYRLSFAIFFILMFFLLNNGRRQMCRLSAPSLPRKKNKTYLYKKKFTLFIRRFIFYIYFLSELTMKCLHSQKIKLSTAILNIFENMSVRQTSLIITAHVANFSDFPSTVFEFSKSRRNRKEISRFDASN